MSELSNNEFGSLIVVVPAAGIGKRMKADCPKQYLKIGELTILEHTVLKLLSHDKISQVVLAISAEDEYFSALSLSAHPDVFTVDGGTERVDSVLAGLKVINQTINPWVLVHDAARPCIALSDIDALIESCRTTHHGGLLASPVRDTMKRSGSSEQQIQQIQQTSQRVQVTATVDRSTLWHALTPQMYQTALLIAAIEQAVSDHALITDESSAIEHVGLTSLLVEGSSENIKITRPEDLALAAFYLTKSNNLINQVDLCE